MTWLIEKWERTLEWAFYRRPVLALALAVALIAILIVLISAVGGGSSTSDRDRQPAAVPTTTAPVVTSTGARQTFRATDDPVLIASAFVRSWLLGSRVETSLDRRAWLDGVTAHTTDELTDGLRRTDTATIPNTSLVPDRRPDAEGGIETGGAIVTYDLADGTAVIVTMIYNPETGEWLVSGIEPGRRR